MLERRRIIQALKNNDLVQQKAARALGISPRQLGYRIRVYGFTCEAYNPKRLEVFSGTPFLR